jgi:uncharacterized protein (TIGR00369 family)
MNPAAIDRRLGFEATADGALQLPPRPDLLNHQDHSHGGAVMALLEAALRRAAAAQGEAWHGAQTLDLHVSFVSPGRGLLTADARVSGGGRRLCFAQAQVRDADGALVAQALSTLRCA